MPWCGLHETTRFLHSGYKLLRRLHGPLLADEISEATGDVSSSRATASAIGVARFPWIVSRDKVDPSFVQKEWQRLSRKETEAK
jgi:hypothetical protein